MAFINILEQPLLFIVSLSYLLFSVTISSRALHAPHQETRTSRHSIFKTAIRSSWAELAKWRNAADWHSEEPRDGLRAPDSTLAHAAAHWALIGGLPSTAPGATNQQPALKTEPDRPAW